MKRYLAIGLAVVLPVLAGCNDRLSVARDFYAKTVVLDKQEKALEAYGPRQKWFIYSYGMRNGEVHAIGLTRAVAKGGKPVLDAVTADLESGGDDLDYAPAWTLFNAIQFEGGYDICGDSGYYNRLSRLARRLKDPGDRDRYLRGLVDMCIPDGDVGASAGAGAAR